MESWPGNEIFTEYSSAKILMTTFELLDPIWPLEFLSGSVQFSHYANTFFSVNHKFDFSHITLKYSYLKHPHYPVNEETNIILIDLRPQSKYI